MLPIQRLMGGEFVYQETCDEAQIGATTLDDPQKEQNAASSLFAFHPGALIVRALQGRPQYGPQRAIRSH
jgi:hypothetical protein